MLTQQILENEVRTTENQPQSTIALMPCGVLFEDFFDTVGVSLEVFRTEQTGGWMFNYIEALQLVGVQTVLIFVSARVSQTLCFKHEPTGAKVCILPAPILHRSFRYITRKISNRRFYRHISSYLRSLDSYLILPLRLLAHELKQHDINAIVFQDYEYPSFDVCVLLGKFIKMPVFATFQGGARQMSRLERPIRPLALRASQGLIIGPQTEIQRVQDKYQLLPQQIAHIFNPMDVTAWHSIDRGEARTALGIPQNARVVISHGRIDIAHKGLDILLETWQQICDERPNQELCLLLVGSGSDAPELQRRIAAMQLTNILWINEYIRDRDLIWQYLSAADIYVLASRREGFPVAPIEAMACGIPVIATDVNGIRDIFNENELSGGIIVPREDPKALALALDRVLDDETLRNQLGKQARKRAEQAFSFETIARQMNGFLFENPSLKRAS